MYIVIMCNWIGHNIQGMQCSTADGIMNRILYLLLSTGPAKENRKSSRHD